METKHTPGPWEVSSGDNYEIRSPLMPREYPHHCKEDSTGDFVAYIGNHAPDFGWANACLIAAAPDLLDVVQALMLARQEGVPAADILDENSPLIDAAREALAKAQRAQDEDV